MSVRVRQQHPEAGAHHRLVVGDEDADRHRPSRRAAAACCRTKPPPFAVPARHLAAVDLDALADADQAVAAAVAGAAAAAVVADLDPQLVAARSATVTSARLAWACLSALVSPSWTIRYAERSSAARQRDAARPRPAARRAGRRCAISSSSGVERRRGRAEARARRRRLAPHRAEQPAHLGQRGAARCARRPRAPPGRRRAPSGSPCRTAPTCSTITLIAWATMSCSSRAIRARSSATAMRASVSRSRSARAARASAASACSARARSAKPATPDDREQHRQEDEVARPSATGRCR